MLYNFVCQHQNVLLNRSQDKNLTPLNKHTHKHTNIQTQTKRDGEPNLCPQIHLLLVEYKIIWYEIVASISKIRPYDVLLREAEDT